MKKKLFVTASSVVLGALLVSPLHAMEEEDRANSKKRNCSFLVRDLGHSNESPAQKRPSLNQLTKEQRDWLEDIKYAHLNSTVFKTENKYSIEDYRKARNTFLNLGIQYFNKDIFMDGISLAHQVTFFKEEATDVDWRIARNAYADLGNYSIAHYFMRDIPHYPKTPLEWEDMRVARFLCLQTQAFDEAYKHSQRLIQALDNNATFEDYCPLILSYIGSHGLNDTETIYNYIKILENKWGQDPQVQFFISFLYDIDASSKFSPRFVEKARNLPINTATPFTQILKIFALEGFEDIGNLEKDFCYKYSKHRYDSELSLIRTIYETTYESEESEDA